MKGSYICTRCGKSLASSQSLWNHKQRCKSASRPRVGKNTYRITGEPQTTPSPYSKNSVKNDEREKSEKVRDLYRNLNKAARSTPLDFQPIGEEPISPPPHDETTEKEAKESSLSNDESMVDSCDASSVEDEKIT